MSLSLFVWQDVLRDYTAGMVVAVAPDLESALDTLEPYISESMGGAPYTRIDLDGEVKAQSWFVYGGG